jgi:hypothetical protein
MKLYVVNTKTGYHLSYINIEDFIMDFNDGLISSETMNLYTDEQEAEINKLKQTIEQEAR